MLACFWRAPLRACRRTVFSGLDAGLATAPMIFGPVMDGGHFSTLWDAVAVLQGLAVLSALLVGRQADPVKGFELCLQLAGRTSG